MALTRIIGDIHGKFFDYEMLIKNAEAHKIERSIQVGDFGIGFAGPYWHEQVNNFHNINPGAHRFIRGNHDDPNKCRNDMTGFIKDGTVENDVMMIGGAWSIDHQWRTIGVNMWVDEELSVSELNMLIGVYETVKPRVMITHDCPTDAARELFISPSGVQLAHKPVQFKTRTAEAFQAMWEIHQPDFHFFGHWHQTRAVEMNGTIFVCLGECDFIDVDLDDPDLTRDILVRKFNL